MTFPFTGAGWAPSPSVRANGMRELETPGDAHSANGFLLMVS